MAAFDDDDQLILFLPVKDVEGYTVVHPELLKNPETKQFITDIGVKQPSLKDQIYTIILPQYKDGGSPDSKAHFKLFFKYYRKCSTDEVDEFIDLIKDYPILQFHEDGKVLKSSVAVKQRMRIGICFDCCIQRVKDKRQVIGITNDE